MSDESNPIVNVPIYRSYCIFRLPNLESLDGAFVLATEQSQSSQRFLMLREQWKNTNILQTKGFCPPILDQCFQIQSNNKNNINILDVLNDLPNEMNDITIHYTQKNNNQFATTIVKQAIKKAQQKVEIKQRIQRIWPNVIKKIIEQTMQDLHSL